MLYYFFQNAFNIHKVLEFIEINKLNKFDTIFYLDTLYYRTFKIRNYYSKQYKLIISVGDCEYSDEIENKEK